MKTTVHRRQLLIMSTEAACWGAKDADNWNTEGVKKWRGVVPSPADYESRSGTGWSPSSKSIFVNV